MDRIFDAALYCDHAPTFTFANGTFHVSYQVGALHAEFVMLPHIWRKAIRAANKVTAEFEATQSVVPMRRQRVHS